MAVCALGAQALRTAEYYRARGGALHRGGKFRTHPMDPDPLVVTFDEVFDETVAAQIIEAARPVRQQWSRPHNPNCAVGGADLATISIWLQYLPVLAL
jgi:hypothetical protein